VLLQSEKEKYGDRCPLGYRKIDLLGKGGIALVWLAEVQDAEKTGLPLGQKVALKQFPKVKGIANIDSSAKIEIETGNTLFPWNEEETQKEYAVDPSLNPGIKSIAMLIDQIHDKSDFWLVYEVGAKSLGRLLVDVKGEFYKGERIYNCSH
jgi:serine/threonine protein kinase